MDVHYELHGTSFVWNHLNAKGKRVAERLDHEHS